MQKKKVVLFLTFFLIIALISSYFIIISILPETLSIIKDSESSLNLYFPFNLYVKGQSDSNLVVNGREVADDYVKVNTKNPLTLKGNEVGESYLDLNLFGFIPLRKLKVNILPEVKVYPGGHALGVIMRSQGVMVVGLSSVENSRGRNYPAKDAGIEVGDVILEIEGEKINDKIKLSEKIQKYGREKEKLDFKIKKQNGNIKEIKISPVENEYGENMIGLFVDDGVAGVGTLTFYDENSREYGALGHMITEAQSQTKIEIREGKIVEAQISGISSGRQGTPGEKQGTFFHPEDVLGSIDKNSNFGIFGTLKKQISNPYFKEPISVAPISEIKEGKAKLYTVVEGGEIGEYEVQIERIYRQASPDSKGMVINITDPKLKNMTGGIIQGMSGSPIVQNNKLIGAVTHVFVNNPTRGYGVFAEWMLRETEILNNNYKYSKVG
ncbi:MAG: SpoIVB peptidase [bacterium]